MPFIAIGSRTNERTERMAEARFSGEPNYASRAQAAHQLLTEVYQPTLITEESQSCEPSE